MTSSSAARSSRRSHRPETNAHAANVAGIDGWSQFLQRINDRDPRLCHVLAENSRPLRAAAKRSGVADPLMGFPWLTPVLGSGCASQPNDEQLRTLAALPAVLSRTIEVVVVGGNPGLAPDLVNAFARSLVEQRVQQLRGRTFSSADEVVPDPGQLAVAHCVLAAALVRKAWHESVAHADSVVRSRDWLQVPVDDGREVRSGLLQPAADCLDTVLALLDQAPDASLDHMKPVVTGLLALLRNVLSGGDPRLTGHDVDGLVEVAWLMLITPVGLYPGWRDVMTTTALQASLQGQAFGGQAGLDFAHPRPTLQDVDVAAPLAASIAALESATSKSWAARATGASSAQHAFYDAVADVLIAQRRFRQITLPTPTAFVTSMDLELEMSLLRRGERFTVLLPYHFLFRGADSEQRAMLFWLAGTIDPVDDEALALMEQPTLSSLDIRWRPAPNMPSRDTDGIVVVRLVGSPLMPAARPDAMLHHDRTGKPLRQSLLKRICSLAALAADTDAETFNEEFDEQDLMPAFMLDEYSGLHQMTSVAQGGLSSGVLTLEPASLYRYWLAAGVQLDDVLVRLLFAAHVDTSTGLRGMVKNHGVVVNRQMSRTETDLLAWQGFDAVQSTFDRLTADLVHYAAHLRADETDGFRTTTCSVGAPHE